MIHVVTMANRDLYKVQLLEMHALRRKHFVEERGWRGMYVRDGGEYDAYDDDLAVYLLAVESDGSISCSMRMRPALTGSVLGDIFPHLIAADEPSIRRADTWEISRYFAAGAMRGRGGARRRAQIRMASLEVARTRHVRRLVGMIDIEMLPPMLNGSGWRVRPLGLPAPYTEGVVQAIDIEVCAEALVEMAESQGLETPLALELDPARCPALPPQDLEALLGAARLTPDRQRVLSALMRRLAVLQDKVEEDELLALVDQVRAILVSPGAASSALQ